MSAPVLACIGLGANLGNPQRTLHAALDALQRLPESRLVAASRLYRTAAWGGVAQPDYLNAAAVVETTLSAHALLQALLDIEQRAGRVRDVNQRWGPRILDLDVLLYGEQCIDAPGLCVPHPHLHERAFALLPLAEIAGALPFPGHGSVAEALQRIDIQGVALLDEA